MRTAQVFLRYVDWVGQGDTTRAEASHHFGVSKSTATYHLERAVSEGHLVRFCAWCKGEQTGWAYRSTENQPSFEELEMRREEEEHDLALAAIEEDREVTEWRGEKTPTL